MTCASWRWPEKDPNMLELKFHCFNCKTVYFNGVNFVGVVLRNY